MVNKSSSSSPEKAPFLEPALLSACIHCGLCLPACPTYLASGLEMESPRGRIYLLAQLAKENLATSKQVQKHIDSCLGCMGCQSACPSGVQYERILEQAKYNFTTQKPAWKRFIQRAIFSFLLPNQKLLSILTRLLQLYQELKLEDILEHLPVSSQSATRLRWWNSLSSSFFLAYGKTLPAQDYTSAYSSPVLNSVSGKPVQIFHGCVMNVLFKQVNQATAQILWHQGYSVSTPAQTCCGALAAHAGEKDIARKLAERNMEFFARTTGNIVVTASGCAAMMKEYEYLFDDEIRKERAQNFAKRIKDTVEILNDTIIEQKLPITEAKVSYHAACHLCHVQKIHQEPIDILKAACGDRFVPLEEAENCCGSAGIYNLLQPEISKEIRERKIDCVEASNCNILVTTNPGCQLQIAAGLKERNSTIKVLHISELISLMEN